MLGSNLTRDEYIKEIKKLRKEIGARVRRIEAGESLPQFASERYRELTSQIRGKLSNYSLNELKDVYRDMYEIGQMKTSTVAGAKRYNYIVGMDKNVRKLYNKLVEENALFEHFKYDILEFIDKWMNKGKSEAEIAEQLRSEYEGSRREFEDVELQENAFRTYLKARRFRRRPYSY